MSRFFKATLLSLALMLTALSGCNADQPPETSSTSAAAPVQEAAAVAASEKIAETVSDPAPPAQVPATNEELPEDDELVLAQADEAQPAKPAPAPAKTAPYRVGDHYTLLKPAQPTSAPPGKVEIAESFMYGCPHCFSIEPFIEKWLPTVPDYVEFVRIPALFNAPARVHARAYYTAETLNILEQAHMAFFREIHVNRKSMTSMDELAEFFAGFDIDGDTFRNTYNSFAVDTKLRRAEALGRRYRITSTPTVVVNGKYLANGDKIRTYDEIFDIAQYLAAREAGRE